MELRRTVRTLLVVSLFLMVYQSNSQESPDNLTLPARAAFYYPWFPETWTVNGSPVIQQPSLGLYASTDEEVIDHHIQALNHAEVDVALASWWGPNTYDESIRLQKLLKRTQALGVPLKWSLYYEAEGRDDPSVSELRANLDYIREAYFGPSYAVVSGKPVIFVYSADDTDCDVAQRWRKAAADWYVSLKVFPGYRSCTAQPDAWHQYGPAVPADHQVGYSYTISPGFWRADEGSPRLERNLIRWRQNIRAMVASNEPWQLITTFNEWGEGTAIEEAVTWETDGYGSYLEALADTGAETARWSTGSERTGITVATVGDIACDPTSFKFNGGNGTEKNCRHQAIADIIGQVGADVFLPLGDLQYEDGMLAKFLTSYDLVFDKYKDITYPIVGNHEYLTPGAQGYFDYFGARANDPSRGYYSFDLGTWHVVALNTNCSQVEGCEAGSPQERWLRDDLAAHSSKCTLAFMHHPRFSSGRHGNDAELEALWRALYDHGAELVLAGHDHIYERFAPQTPTGVVDPEGGIRQFIVGTGGKNHTDIAAPQPNSEVRQSGTYGLLKLTLQPNSYRWTFVPVANQSYADTGRGNCH